MNKRANQILFRSLATIGISLILGTIGYVLLGKETDAVQSVEMDAIKKTHEKDFDILTEKTDEHDKDSRLAHQFTRRP